MSYRYVKVFGERNTGTNFLGRLLAANCDGVEVLDHGSNEAPRRAAKRFKGGPRFRELVLNRLIDAQRAAEYPQNFGWKHACVRVADLRRSPRFAETLFVFLLRNPYSFVRSLHRRPYNVVAALDAARCSVADFVDLPILLNERERADVPVIESPVELWNLKVGSSLAAAAELGDAGLVVHYEELVLDPPALLARVAARGIAVRPEIAVPQQSTKGDERTLADFQCYVTAYQPRDDLGAAVVERINARLDRRIYARTRYAELYPIDAPAP